MNILFYTHDLCVGGAQRVISILTDQFVQLGHKVAVILYSEYQTVAYPLPPEVEVQCLNNHFGLSHPCRNFRELRRTRRHMLAFSPDAVITFYANDTVIAHLALAGCHIPIIYSQRCDPYSATRREQMYTPLATTIARGIVFQSTKARDYYSTKVRRKSCVIMNPLILNSLPQSPVQIRKKVIVSVGRLSEQKHQSLLIKAFHAIQDRIPDYQLHIYGDGPLRSQLTQLIAQLSLQEKVILQGNVSNVIQRIHDASLFVLPSRYEGIPNALIEAMCVGLPCISTNWSPHGAVTDLIQNGQNGIILPDENTETLSQTILHLLSDTAYAQKLGRQAQKLTVKVEASQIASQWLNLISQCL